MIIDRISQHQHPSYQKAIWQMDGAGAIYHRALETICHVKVMKAREPQFGVTLPTIVWGHAI